MVVGIAAFAFATMTLNAVRADAASYVPLSGAGSTWSQNALDQWIRNVSQDGMRVSYQGSGSTDGRSQFRNGTVDFGMSEVPYGLPGTGTTDLPPTRSYAYLPLVAGGTAFMYNLRNGSQRFTNLRLSEPVLAGIFTGTILSWADPAIAADNPGVSLPAIPVIPVVRADSSGTSYDLTRWLASQSPDVWNAFCGRAGRPNSPCSPTAQFPVVAGGRSVPQSGSLGVAGYTAQDQSNGAITYVEKSYALNVGFPIAQVLNAAGFYVAPNPGNVGIGLEAEGINADPASPAYLTQDPSGVYSNPDARSYPLSSYSYMIIPTSASGDLSTAKGATLSAFAHYAICQGQQQATVLGYAPLPKNLVEAGLQQLQRLPGADPTLATLSNCPNPTFDPNGTDLLANTPQPPACDHVGAQVCGTTSPTGSGSEVSGIETSIAPGALVLSVSFDGPVLLPTPSMDVSAGLLVTRGAINPVTITDTRAGAPGFTVSAVVTDFSDSATQVINGSNLGWTPRVIDQAAGMTVTPGTVVMAAAGIQPGATPTDPSAGLKSSRALAISPPGALGTAHLGAELLLQAPTNAAAATYDALLTLTAI
jgi:phosphate ABC transporter phosphate-binding protein